MARRQMLISQTITLDDRLTLGDLTMEVAITRGLAHERNVLGKLKRVLEERRDHYWLFLQEVRKDKDGENRKAEDQTESTTQHFSRHFLFLVFWAMGMQLFA